LIGRKLKMLADGDGPLLPRDLSPRDTHI